MTDPTAAAEPLEAPETPGTPGSVEPVATGLVADELIEEVSIDGMCGVY